MAYGLRPVTHGGYNYNTGGFDSFPIKDAADAIGNGDLVKLDNAGGIVLATTSPTTLIVSGADEVDAPGNQVLGVFVGCEYTDNNGRPTWGQNYPGSGSTDADEAQTGFVVTDPNAVFKVSSGSGTANAWADEYIGEVYALANLSSASAVTGNSGITIADLATTVSTPTVGGAVRVIGVIKDGNNETSNVTTPDVLIRWADPTVLHYGYGLSV
jgi:hypothetical protein